MFKRTLINRSLLTGLVVGAASFPAGAQARYAEDPSASASGTAAPLVSTPPVQQRLDRLQSNVRQRFASSTAGSHSGFQWGDAGIGAAGALLLVAIGSGTAVAVRRRSGVFAG